MEHLRLDVNNALLLAYKLDKKISLWEPKKINYYNKNSRLEKK